ncbi:TetR/AcrR family transcriptional regulator [Microbacterium sediminicola]|uniref:TetR/AcrR family transcriptional regulator n=1 Tax=Microbacterium sediminicola TaxID=415210 RepID=A0ABN2IJA6_9MICO
MPDTAETTTGRDRIVACALELLHADRPDELSIREVSRRAGVASGTPYHHFGDKAGLLAACARVGWDDLTARLQAVDAEGAIVDQISALAAEYATFAFENPGCYRLMMARRFDDPSRFADLDARRAVALEAVIGRLASSPSRPAEKSRAMAMWSMMHGYVMLRLDGAATGDGDPEAQLQALAEMVARIAVLSWGGC